MTCRSCGRAPERGVETHYIGCKRAKKAPEPESPATEPGAEQCAREGCMNPRMVSKGPRAAKYCEEHKTRKGK